MPLNWSLNARSEEELERRGREVYGETQDKVTLHLYCSLSCPLQSSILQSSPPVLQSSSPVLLSSSPPSPPPCARWSRPWRSWRPGSGRVPTYRTSATTPRSSPSI